MLKLITDRTQANVNRLNELHAKGWDNLTDAEKAEWTGDPEAALGAVNLIPTSGAYSSAVDTRFTSDSIVLTATQAGRFLHTVIVLGDAADYTNQTFTFSLTGLDEHGNADGNAAVYWYHPDTGSYSSASLMGDIRNPGGWKTFTTDDNPNGYQYFALFLYVSTSVAVEPGDYVRYTELMLERGDVKHPYVQYSESVPTMATKGAYNYTDLNRVELAVADLAERMGLSLVTKTDWTMWDVPTKADMDRYLNNVITLHKYSPKRPDSPTLPTSMTKLDYTAANNIEKVLMEIDVELSSTNRCGELFCGEV